MLNRSVPSPVGAANAAGSASALSPNAPSLTGGLPQSVAPPPRTSVAMKNYGPPTLQSDTVVFQAAKIPVSSARQNVVPVAPAGPSAVLGSRGGLGGRQHAYPQPHPGYDRRGDVESRGDMYRGGYSQLSPSQMSHRPDDYTPSPNRGQPNVRGSLQGGLRGGAQPPMYRDERGRIVDNDLPRPPMERDETSLSGDRAPKKQRTQRQSRPSSAESSSGRNKRYVRLTITVIKEGDKLGFGIRNDSNRKLKVSTLQSNTTASKSSLKIGDTLLSVNGIDLHNLGFLEVIQQLKATKPGELVFDVEREIDEDDVGGPGDSSSQNGDFQENEKVQVTAESHVDRTSVRDMPTPVRDEQVPPPSMHRSISGGSDLAISGPIPPLGPSGAPIPSESRNKRPRPMAGMTPSQMEMELVRTEKQHKAVLSALTLELKKERTEKLSLEEKNVALRKRLQNMLIECDEVRVKASSTVASIKEQAQREVHELQHALQEARARMRLLDRGPDVARTDSIVNDLINAKEQVNRLRRIESERSATMSNRYNYESRLAEREALRTRDRLISLFQSHLREVARRHYNNAGVKSGANQSHLVVQVDGFRRLGFLKLFSLPCSLEWYASDDFVSPSPMRHTLQSHDDIVDLFGNVLCHEERAGLFLVATAPMTVSYDPVSEKLTLSCPWTEQNQIRELARNFRF